MYIFQHSQSHRSSIIFSSRSDHPVTSHFHKIILRSIQLFQCFTKSIATHSFPFYYHSQSHPSLKNIHQNTYPILPHPVCRIFYTQTHSCTSFALHISQHIVVIQMFGFYKNIRVCRNVLIDLNMQV